jgi:endonuclease YncB( thermonuclease family)
MQLVANYHPGTFHFAGTDWMNMYQFGRAVAEVFDLDSSLVNPVQVSAGLPTEKAPPEELEQGLRPDILGLDCTQTNHRLGLRAFSVVNGLQEMLV